MKKVIIAGSEGLIGSEISRYLGAKANFQIIKADIRLGHDLTDETFVKEWFKNNKADCIVNTFALNDHVDQDRKSSSLFDLSLQSIESYMKVNVVSLFSVCREYARNNDGGSIINFSSTYGISSPYPQLYKKGQEKHIGYCISKSAVVQLTKYLATHLPNKFRSNCIIPGGVRHQQEQNFIDEYSAKTPMDRMMEVHELNGIVEYLCSDNASYTSGASFVIDGGWTAW